MFVTESSTTLFMPSRSKGSTKFLVCFLLASASCRDVLCCLECCLEQTVFGTLSMAWGGFFLLVFLAIFVVFFFLVRLLVPVAGLLVVVIVCAARNIKE